MYIEDRIKNLEEQVIESQKIIQQLQDKTKRQTDIISCLIGGLFHKDTQQNFKQLLYDILDGKHDFSIVHELDISPWKQQPTTIQCEAIEETVEYLQSIIENLDIRIKKIEEKID